MPRTIGRALIVSLMLGAPSCGPKPRPLSTSAGAWWVTAAFAPAFDTVAGLPIRQLDSTWTGALGLSRSVLPPEAAKDMSGLADSSVAFELHGDFNHDGHQDRALVGVYRTTADSTGRFLLIQTREHEQWVVSYLAQQPGPAGFSVLSQVRDTLVWAECMECDVFWELAWNGHEYDVLPVQADGIDE
jgi:hypothetical protein